MEFESDSGELPTYRPGIAARLAGRFIESLEARDWPAWEALLSPDVVYEMPQSHERIRGRENYLRFNQEYPGDWHLTPVKILGDDTDGAVLFRWQLDGAEDLGIVFVGVTDDLITAVTDFWPEPFEPQPGREHLVERW